MWGLRMGQSQFQATFVLLGMRACEAQCVDAGALYVSSATLGSDRHGCGCRSPVAHLLCLHLQEVLLQEEKKQEGEGQGHEECHEHEGHERGTGRTLGRGWEGPCPAFLGLRGETTVSGLPQSNCSPTLCMSSLSHVGTHSSHRPRWLHQ